MMYIGRQLAPTEKPSVALLLNWHILAKMSANPIDCLRWELYGVKKVASSTMVWDRKVLKKSRLILNRV